MTGPALGAMSILQPPLSSERAKAVIAFFDSHPDREDCVVEIGGLSYRWTREYLPHLAAVAGIEPQ